MRIDLHTHSSVSDGTDSPADLMRRAAEAGLDVVALTDHDTTAGWAEAAEARPEGLGLVRGTELSTQSEGISVHLLCYLQDPEHPALVEELDRIRRARLTRARSMVDRLSADFALSWQDVEDQSEPGTTIGRPHIADALVARGHVPDRSAAFGSVLRPGTPYYVPYYAPDVCDAVALVRRAGGVPVLAHPGAAARGRIVSDAVIERMAQAGLAGIEIRHRDHGPEQRERLAGLARRLGLLETGSSDYHGTGKPNLLGENSTSPEALATIVEQGALPVLV